MTGRAAEMQLACAQAREYLGAATQILGELADEGAGAEQAARAHELVTSYVQLAGEAVNRFQEAAHGA